MKAHYEKGGLGDVKVKRYLNEVLQEMLAPIREKREELSKNKENIYKILADGTEKAKMITSRTLAKVKKAMKIGYEEICNAK